MRTLVVGMVLAGSVTVSTGIADGSVDEVVDREMSSSVAPGLAYAVVADGQIASAGARGVVRRGSDQIVTADTPFLTGSVSKSFTALSVMQLVEAGEIQLDAAASRYLVDFAGRPGDATIRQLLSHTSGYSTAQGNAPVGDDLGRCVARIARAEPARGAGERWEYSNTNYQILGRVVEVVSGQEYGAYVAEHILEPAGMENSFVVDDTAHPTMATGHRPWFGTKRPLSGNAHRGCTAPQGGVVASAIDLARFLLVLMNGRDDLLSAAGKGEMMRPAGEASPFYGLGWFVDPDNGTVWHSGASPGYETLATLAPARGEGAVVLVNAGSGLGFGETTQLRNAVTAEALGLDYDGEGSRVWQKALFVGLLLLPLVYAASMAWAWRHRAVLRAKDGAFGVFSLWFPLLTTTVAAWVILRLVPNLVGAPLATIRLFQPDLAIALVASALTGVVWAVFRLVVARTGRTVTSDQEELSLS